MLFRAVRLGLGWLQRRHDGDAEAVEVVLEGAP